jgi:hypothetical protein
MRKTFVAILVIVSFVLMLPLVACSDKGGGLPTEPSPTVPSLSVSTGRIDPAVGSTITVGMGAIIEVNTSGSIKVSADAVVLVRDDGLVYMMGCGSTIGGGSSTWIAFQTFRPIEQQPKGVYAFAKGHTLNAVVLHKNGIESMPENVGGCYFSPASNDPSIVFFDRAQGQIKVPLNWRVE